MQQNTPPDGDYFSNIDPSDVFDKNSDNDADHVDNNKDNNLDNFDVNENKGFNEDDADTNQDIFDADEDNPRIFDADDIDGIEDVSLGDVDDGFFQTTPATPKATTMPIPRRKKSNSSSR